MASGMAKARIRVGVIGTGGIARVHLAALRDLPEVDLAALCDTDPGRLGAAMARWGGAETRPFSDYRQMLDDVRPDAVWVLVSVPATFAVTAECLRRGVDTLLEKPPGLRTSETRELADLARRQGCRAMVAFNRRFNPWVGRAREALAACGGPPPAVIVAEYHKGPQQYEHYPREVNERWIGVDAIHALDLVKHLGGDVQDIRASSGRHLHGDLPDSFSGVLTFAGGTVGHLVSTYTSVPKIERLQLFGDRCWAVAEGIGSGMVTARLYRDGDYHDLALPESDARGTDVLGYWAEDRHYVRCILEGGPLSPPACDLDEAATTMALVDVFLAGVS